MATPAIVAPHPVVHEPSASRRGYVTPRKPTAPTGSRAIVVDDAWGRLMARAQAGDRLAYGQLLVEIVPYLRSIASRYLGSSPDLEDAVQEILMSVHAIRHTYEPSRPFRPWLVTIASRRLIDALRRRSRNLLHEVETTDTMPEMASDDPDPSAIADRIVDIREVRRAIAGLPPRQREAVQLLRLQELSLDEAATASGQSPGSLKVACHRALKSLARILQGGTGGGGAHD